MNLFRLTLICICSNEVFKKDACNKPLITEQPRSTNINSKGTKVLKEETSKSPTESKTCREICLDCRECFGELGISCTVYSTLSCNFICNCCRFA